MNSARAQLHDFIESLKPQVPGIRKLMIFYTSYWLFFFGFTLFIHRFFDHNTGTTPLWVQLMYLSFALLTCATIASLLRWIHFFELHMTFACSAIAATLLYASEHPHRVGIFLISSLMLLFASLVLAIMAGPSAKIWFYPLKVSRRMRPKEFPERSPGRYRLLLVWVCPDALGHQSIFRRQTYPPILPYLATLVPSNWDVVIWDQAFDPIDLDIDVDVVGFTTMAPYFRKIQALAPEFQKRGRRVIVGGPDCSLRPDAYFGFTDSVLVGNAEGFLEKMLLDFQNGQLQKKYHNPSVFDLKGMNLPRLDLLPQRRYANVYNVLVSTSCPFNCAFCTYNRTQEPRLRPAHEVRREMDYLPAKYFWLEAPELLAYKRYVSELKHAMKGSGYQFSTHTTIRSALNKEILLDARAAGLRGVWLGLESYSPESLKFANKKMNRVEMYADGLDLLSRVGVSANVHLIFGLPYDKLEDYRRALSELIQHKVTMINQHLLGAYHGDEIFEKNIVAAGGRDFERLKHIPRANSPYRFFYPKDIAEEDFVQAYNGFSKEFYSYKNIFRRLFLRHWRSLPNLIADLMLNLHVKYRNRNMEGGSHVFDELIKQNLFDQARPPKSDNLLEHKNGFVADPTL